MSSPHPNLHAWIRDEHDGFYEASLHDWELRVVWTPNTVDKRGSFHWHAKRDQVTHQGHDHCEEMEHAMAYAEQFAALDAAKRTAALVAH